ncbi:MAG: hypothetical protein ACLGJC_01985 [Alphaproteobacteria bacterium]
MTIDAGIFDDMYRLHLLGSSAEPTFKAVHQEMLHQILRTPARMSLSSEISTAVREIRKTCETAGFPLERRGLGHSFA